MMNDFVAECDLSETWFAESLVYIDNDLNAHFPKITAEFFEGISGVNFSLNLIEESLNLLESVSINSIYVVAPVERSSRGEYKVPLPKALLKEKRDQPKIKIRTDNYYGLSFDDDSNGLTIHLI